MLLPSFLAFIVLTSLVGYSYYWNIENVYNEKLNLALAEAKSNWKKDAAFRQWAIKHGGLYVKPSKRTPPSPYMAHIPNRDVVTTNGVKLTLMAPASMMRQMTEEFKETYGTKGKITAKILLNPNNKADNWQLKQLDYFERRNDKNVEVYEQQLIGNKPYLRYMKPMYMVQSCMKCHGHLGFNVGDLRGGVSVSIPLSPYFEAAKITNIGILRTHLAVWFMGLVAIALITILFRKLIASMAHTAMHDELTKLPNSKLFKNRLDVSFKMYQRNPKHKFAVCFMDLDRFKNLNDSYGHAFGDMLLIDLSARLRELLRPGDTVARMGGDEFLILLNSITNISEAVIIIERTLSLFEQPFLIDNKELYSSSSIGICMVSNQYNQADEMIRDADIAMYRAKKSNKVNIDIFNPEMHDEAVEEMQIENDLRTALEKNQFEVYYQPVIDALNKRISGFEALLRWHHPDKGLIPPDHFIPIAERTGQISKIGAWVLQKSCEQVYKWNTQYSPDVEFTLAVNLSGIQIHDPDIFHVIENALLSSRLNKNLLHLEVTESMLLDQKETAKFAIAGIQYLGISVSIDDFGTGYCSLSYLQDFDFNTLKIDKSFVQSKGKGQHLVKSLMLLAQNLDMQVVAEGVETKEQLDFILSMSCYPLIQGYYYSRPISASDTEVILQSKYYLDTDKFIKAKKSDAALS